MKFILSTLFVLSIQCLFANEDHIKSHSPTFTWIQEDQLWEKWDSPEGILRLQSSNAKENFWNLIRFYESQMTLTYCSIASTVMVLNALSIEAPESRILGKYRMFTQEEFFSDTVLTVIDQKDVAKRGMSLEELEAVLKTFPIEVLKYEALDFSHEEIRYVIVSALKNPHQGILAQYHRGALKQDGGGHWSPVAAYDAESDSFLVLDVARYKYPPVWVKTSAFINSMQTTNVNNESRGFIIIEKKTEISNNAS